MGKGDGNCAIYSHQHMTFRAGAAKVLPGDRAHIVQVGSLNCPLVGRLILEFVSGQQAAFVGVGFVERCQTHGQSLDC